MSTLRSALNVWPRARCIARWMGAIASISAAIAVSGATNTNEVVPKHLADIKPPVEITTPGEWLARIAVALCGLALLALAWWLWRRRRPPEEPAGRSVPPEERARQRLTAALALIENPERFCTTVSEIARTYLEERFGLKAPERTTEEFLAELTRSVVLDARHKDLLGEFLTQCDLVKFAKFEPGRRELEDLHNAAFRLVEETAPRLAPPVLPQPQAAR